LKFLFDNNLPPSLARGIGELSKFDPAVQQVIPLRDKFRENEPDPVWLETLLRQKNLWASFGSGSLPST
jgi:hypothetical protein